MIFGKHFNRYYIRYGWLLLLGLFALVIVDVGQLKVPEVYRMVVNGMNTGFVELDGAIYAFDLDFLLDRICLPLIITIFMIVTGRFLWRVCFFGAAIRVETDLRDRMFDHCRKLSQQYFQVNKVGNLMSLFTNDLETVQDCYGNGVLMFFDALFLGGLALIKMLHMNVTLTAFSLIPMVFLFVAGSIVGKSMSRKWELRQEAFSDLSDFSQESFSGIAVIKAFAKETKELLAFRSLTRRNETANVDYTRISPLLQFIGDFTAIVWPIEAIAFLIEMSAKGKASLKRISELLDQPIDVRDTFDPAVTPAFDAEAFRGEIEFRNLTFTYPGNASPALHDVSFTIRAGENVGIIGRTGSGKTTLVDLITRTYQVPDQTIFVDGRDVNTIPIVALRNQIAYVPQDNFLFSDTIANNIAFAFADANNSAAIEQAARFADVHDNIREFPDGYQAILGERGVTVSGGQKQRISIARALMKQAKILIMDDSVSAVDTKTERVILDNLKKERGGMTTILIAHRVSTVEQMDRILFVEDGTVLAAGTHNELLVSCPAYAEMVELQRLEEERKEREAHA